MIKTEKEFIKNVLYNQDEINTLLVSQILAKQDEVNALVEQLKAVSPHLFKDQKKPSKRFEIPSIREIKEHIESMGYFVDAEQFHAFYSSKNWMIGKNKMKCWKSALVTWDKRAKETHPGGTKPKNGNPANWSDQKISFFDNMMSEDF